MRAIFVGFAISLYTLTLAGQTVTPPAVDESQQQRPATETATGSGQTQSPAQSQSQNGEAERSVLEVKPGEAAIKNKDLYEKTGIFHPFRRMVRFTLTDQKHIWTSPFHTSAADAKYWAIFGVATGTLIALDARLEREAPTNRTLTRLGTDWSYAGAAYTLIPISAGFYLIGSKAGDERFRETGLLCFETLINTTITEEILKTVTDRERPFTGSGRGRFFESNARFNSSFPSGHSINTFGLASIFAHEYHDKLWVKLLAYGYAGGVAGARLAAKKHFPSDTVAGAAMGWFIGDYVYGKRHNSTLDARKTISQKILDHVHFGLAWN